MLLTYSRLKLFSVSLFMFRSYPIIKTTAAIILLQIRLWFDIPDDGHKRPKHILCNVLNNIMSIVKLVLLNLYTLKLLLYVYVETLTVISNYISVYELSRLRTLFLDSFILLLDPKPLHVSAVFCFSHHQVVIKLKILLHRFWTLI
jgi:hypothetical protein